MTATSRPGRVALYGAATTTIAILLTTPAVAQDPDTLELLELLEPIEAGVADVDPLGTSLRNLQLDLRAPSDFDQVYRVPGRSDLLMRIDGGLYAVFAMSRYGDRFGGIPLVPTDTIYFIGPPGANGMDPLAPDPPIEVTSYSELPQSFDRVPRVEHLPVDLRRRTLLTSRLELRVGEEGDPPLDPPPDPSPAHVERHRPEGVTGDEPVRGGPRQGGPRQGGPAILTDAAYRSSRLHALMRRAAEAAQANYAARGPLSSSSSK